MVTWHSVPIDEKTLKDSVSISIKHYDDHDGCEMDQWPLSALGCSRNKMTNSKFCFFRQSENQEFSVIVLNKFLITGSHRAESAINKS